MMTSNIDENRFMELISDIPNIAVQGYDKERVVIYWNKASENIYGFTKEEAIGKKLEELIIPELMKEQVVKSVKTWYENGKAISPSELSLMHKDGSTVYVYSSHIMLAKDTNKPEIFCIDIDISQQKQQEKILKEKDKLLTQQSKLVVMGEMIGNIAHQWRQPLNTIFAGTTAIQMQKDFNNLSDKFLDETCNMINDNTKYLSDTIDDFRNFIKGERVLTLFNLKDNIFSFKNLVESSIKNNNINIIFDLDKDIVINSYPNELLQCYINIFNNSKDAFKNKQEDRYIFISGYKDDNNTIITFKDNAGGIPNDILPKIFNSYFTTKSQNQGTGLGLSMTYDLIVNGMKGDIEVKNSNYKYCNKNFVGAKFTITIPNT